MAKPSRVGELKIRAFDAEERLERAQATIRQLRDDKAKLQSKNGTLRHDALLVGDFMTNVVDALLDMQAAQFQTSESADYIAKVINEAARLNAQETTT